MAALLSLCASRAKAATTTYTSVWAGGTVAPSDTVVLNNGASVTGNVVADGTLQFNQSAGNTLTISSTISGTGVLSVTNAGILELYGQQAVSSNMRIAVGYGILKVLWQNGLINKDNADIRIGSGGAGMLEITNGATAYDRSAYVGESGGSGEVTVTSGSWVNWGSLFVGHSGSGAMLVNGGNVVNTSGYVGYSGVGAVRVSSGTWASSNGLDIGFYGSGSLDVSGGWVSGLRSLGYNVGSIGAVAVSSGTLSGGELFIGGRGTGVLNVRGGLVSGYQGVIANSAGSTGSATVSSGSFGITTYLMVGVSGNGSLNVAGGSVTTGTGFVGFSSRGSGTVAVSSGAWENRDLLIVGYGGKGTVTINGGCVTSGTVLIGFNPRAIAPRWAVWHDWARAGWVRVR